MKWSDKLPNIDEGALRVIARCLAFDPSHRPASCEEILSDPFISSAATTSNPDLLAEIDAILN